MSSGRAGTEAAPRLGQAKGSWPGGSRVRCTRPPVPDAGCVATQLPVSGALPRVARAVHPPAPSLQVIVATNRGEPLVLQKKLTLSGIAYENAARRLIGKQVRGGWAP